MTENKRVRQYKTHLSSSLNWGFNLSWWHSWKSTLHFILVKDRVHLETPLFGHNTVITATSLVLPSNLGNWLKKRLVGVMVCCPDEHFKVTVHGKTLEKQVTHSEQCQLYQDLGIIIALHKTQITFLIHLKHGKADSRAELFPTTSHSHSWIDNVVWNSHLWKSQNVFVLTAPVFWRFSALSPQVQADKQTCTGLVSMEVCLRAVFREALVLVKYTI